MIWLKAHISGVLLAAAIALAADLLARQYGAPAMLFALLIGMAFNFLALKPKVEPGVAFASKTLLRVGVALLGLRLTFADVTSLGWTPFTGVVCLLVFTLAAGIAITRAFGRRMPFGLLSGGAVAICGASAALAIASVLPKRLLREDDVLLTVVAVTALSTVAMVVYPVLFAALGLSETTSGYLIGVTVHDVAQVVGAGYSISETAGDIATFTKLQRVALLPVVLLTITLLYRRDSGGGIGLPWFVLIFIALMILRNILPLPEVILKTATEASRLLLLTAIAALGVKTSLTQIFAAGPVRFWIICTETMALLAMALLFIYAFMP